MTRLRLILPVVLAAASALGGCQQRAQAPRVYPEVGLVRVADGVNLQYRDWGGPKGSPPIVLLTGLGNTAAVFDDLAQRLTAGHRVIGLTRRGFGASTATAAGYDVATRVADDLAALAALGIDRAVLVGHSIAGDELTGIARARGELVAGLVYLDAAFDRTDPGYAVFDECRGVEPAAETVVALADGETAMVGGELQVRSVDAAGRLQAAALGAPAPPAELRAQFVTDPDGVVDTVDTTAAFNAISAGSERTKPDYRGITAPVTALFADWSDPAAAFPTSRLAGPQVRDGLRDCSTRMGQTITRAGPEQVRAQIPGAVVETIPGAPHYLFLTDPDLVVQRILAVAGAI